MVKFSGLNPAVDSAFRFTRMHGEIERHLELSGLAWTHLRPSQSCRCTSAKPRQS